jgi:hypothetical protein
MARTKQATTFFKKASTSTKQASTKKASTASTKKASTKKAASTNTQEKREEVLEKKCEELLKFMLGWRALLGSGTFYDGMHGVLGGDDTSKADLDAVFGEAEENKAEAAYFETAMLLAHKQRILEGALMREKFEAEKAGFETDIQGVPSSHDLRKAKKAADAANMALISKKASKKKYLDAIGCEELSEYALDPLDQRLKQLAESVKDMIPAAPIHSGVSGCRPY